MNTFGCVHKSIGKRNTRAVGDGVGAGRQNTDLLLLLLCCRLNLMNCLESLEEQTCDMWDVE